MSAAADGDASASAGPSPRAAILFRLRAKLAAGGCILGGGAGCGLSARAQEEGGIDLLVIYNSGRYRMAGRGSLAGLMAYGNANQIVVEMAGEVLTAVSRTPVLAGVNGTDPFMLRDRFLRQLKELGFAGIQNFPTVGLIDGVFRQNLEETGMSYQLEVELVAAARRLDLLTTPYVFDAGQAADMAAAGADIIVAHLGLTTSGAIGARTAKDLATCAREVAGIAQAARAVRPEVIVLCHGGPLAEPADARWLLERVPACDGFYGASSMERLPTEVAIAQRVREFARLHRAGGVEQSRPG